MTRRGGALLDNLHVAAAHKRHRVGARLLSWTADAVVGRPEPTGLYLWVLGQNVDAQAFYEARAGRVSVDASSTRPGGVASRITRSPAALRYAWPEPAVLLRQP